VQAINALPVTAGRFTAALNDGGEFGGNAFNGNARWLQVAVRAPAGGGGFTTLAPRQPMNATPYALFALSVPGGAADGHSLDAADGSPTDVVFVNNAGNVGIGTSYPDSRLQILAQDALKLSGYQPYLTLEDTGPDPTVYFSARSVIQGFEGSVAILTHDRQGQPPPFFVQNGPNNVGMGDFYFNPVRQLHVFDSDLFSARFETAHAAAAVVEFRSASSDNTWEYGVSGSAPPFGLGAGDMYMYRQGNDEPGFTISRDNFAASLRCADFKMGHPTRRGSPGRALVDFGDHLVVNFGQDWGYTFVHGRLKCGILEIAGADVAEKFPSSDDNVEPGTVMEIDAEHPGQLRIAREAYSTRVAGVVSGAGDISIGAVLGNLPGHENAPPIALSGRVWVRCDASQAAIAPGDLLTSSDTPGHAMKAADRERAYGTILGKSMTALAQGERGLVLVLVNLQ
jgi:hypothetical protein